MNELICRRDEGSILCLYFGMWKETETVSKGLKEESSRKHWEVKYCKTRKK